MASLLLLRSLGSAFCSPEYIFVLLQLFFSKPLCFGHKVNTNKSYKVDKMREWRKKQGYLILEVLCRVHRAESTINFFTALCYLVYAMALIFQQAANMWWKCAACTCTHTGCMHIRQILWYLVSSGQTEAFCSARGYLNPWKVSWIYLAKQRHRCYQPAKGFWFTADI